MLSKALLGIAILLLIAVAGIYVIGLGVFGSHEEPGEVTPARRPADT